MPDPRPPAASAPRPAPDTVRTAVPSVGARVLAFAAIVLAGAAGGFIGYAFVDLQTTGDATLATGLGALIGALLTAGGTAVVVVLTLRAMGEWRSIQARQAEQARTPDGGAVRRPPRVR